MAENREERRDMVNHPRHYNVGSIECITIVRNMGFDLGSAVKYLWRAESKNGIEDLEKAIWYLRDIKSHDYLRGMFHYVPVDTSVVNEIVKDIQNESIRNAMSTILYSLHYLTEQIIDTAIKQIEWAIELEKSGVKTSEEKRNQEI